MALTKVKAGNILLTTPGASSNDVTPATTAYVTTALANLADSAPSTLDTLNELAAALGDDANFSTTVTNSIAAKLPLAGGTMTGALTSNSLIKTTGDVEIASAQPRLLLDRGDGSYSWNIYNGGGTDFPLSSFNIANNADTAIITALDNGNVGIGTTSPDHQLDIENSSHAVVRLHAGTDSSASLRLQNDAQHWDVNCQTNDTFAIYNQTNSTQPFSILPSGNVGIGTATPAEMLNVESDSASPAILVKAGGQTSSTSPTAELILSPGSLSSNDSACKVIAYRTGDYSSAAVRSNGLRFQTTNANAPVTAMTIDNAGNVGIGTATPGSNHAKANNLVVGSGSAGGMAIFNGTGEGWYAFSRANANNTDSYDGGISYDGSRNLKFHTNAGAARMTITGTGNIGIGTTSPDSILHIEKPSGNNTYLQIKQAGVESWQVGTTASSTALSFLNSGSEKMRLKSNGAVQLTSGVSSVNRKEEVFHTKTVGTTATDFFSVDISSTHRAVFYEIITFGGDWSSHSAARSYYKGFMSGTTSYSGDGQIENSGTYGSGSHIDWTTTRSGSTVTFKATVYSGSVALEAYIRVIGGFGNITLL